MAKREREQERETKRQRNEERPIAHVFVLSTSTFTNTVHAMYGGCSYGDVVAVFIVIVVWFVGTIEQKRRKKNLYGRKIIGMF